MEYRLIATLNPVIESKLFASGDSDDEIYLLLENMLQLSQKIGSVCLIFLPNALKTIFYTSLRLKTILDQIEDVNSSFLFIPTNNISCDFIIKEDDKAYSNLNCIKIIGKTLNGYNFPLLFDIRNSNYIIKQTCGDVCSDDGKQNHCADEYVLRTINLVDTHSFWDNFVEITSNHTARLILRKDVLLAEDLMRLACIIALFFKVPVSAIKNMSEIKITDGFLADIRGLDDEVLKRVAFSIFRAVSFPSATTRERVEHSIDWHRNTPFSYREYKLFRVDVTDFEKSGIRGSGKSRVLIAKNGNKKHIIAFTLVHDFNMRQIEKRLDDIHVSSCH